MTALKGRSTRRLREQKTLPLKLISGSGMVIAGAGASCPPLSLARAGTPVRTARARMAAGISKVLFLPGILIHITVSQVSGNISQIQDIFVIFQGLVSSSFLSLDSLIPGIQPGVESFPSGLIADF